MNSKAEIPEREKWLLDNKTALNQVKKGLKESAEGKVRKVTIKRKKRERSKGHRHNQMAGN